jgi:hypothetical protein
LEFPSYPIPHPQSKCPPTNFPSILGWHAATFDSLAFATKHAPLTSPAPSFPPSVAALTYSLGNAYIVLGLMAILALFISREPRVAKWYLFMVALGDAGHLYASYRAMGKDAFWDFEHYTDVMWGNVVFGVFLCSNRLLTLSGFFGRIGRFTK